MLESSATIPAIIDNQRFLMPLTIELTDQIVLARYTRIDHIHIADSAVRLLLHISPIPFDPLPESKLTIIPHQLNGNRPIAAVKFRVGAKGQRDRLVRQTLEIRIGILLGVDRGPLTANQ